MEDLINLKKLKRKQYPKDVEGENYHKKYYQESDDSEDERVLSRIGRLQTKKYQDKDHIGYDENLNKITKKQHFADKIEEFIQKSENKDWWRVVRDELNNQDVVLTDKQLHFLDRLRAGKQAVSFANNDYYFEYDDFDSFNLLQANVPKRRFQPSKSERIKVNKLVQGIKLGRIRLYSPPKVVDQIYDVWEQDRDKDDTENKYLPPRISAPKQALPTTALSYNPPKSMLFTKEQKEAWLQQDEEDREIEPQQYRYLRYLTQDLFNRCLDLYLCPRVRRKKLMMKSSDFLPQIQSPEQFKPYPTHLNHEFGEKGKDKDQDQRGPILNISAYKDRLAVCYKHCLVVYDIRTTRPLRVIESTEEYFACDYNRYLALLRTGGIELYDGEVIRQNTTIPIAKNQIQWTLAEDDDQHQQTMFPKVCTIDLGDLDPHHVHFHHNGDYFVTTQPTTQKKSMSILVHCISKGTSSQPFQKMKGSTEVQKTMFHPTQPYLVIMTKKHVFVYSLKKQQLIKKLLTGNQWNSSLDIHPYGDNILLGSYDKTVCWFDLDMGSVPYKKMKYHDSAVQKVCFHKTYPLFASCSDDKTINIFHGGVSVNDLSQSALIVPLKLLKSKEAVTDILFHPSQPWIFSVSNQNVYLWT